jgi:NitT/TauT family transport system substrate-binding protein
VVGGDMSSFGLIVARNDVPTPNAARGYPAFMADIKGKKVGIGSRGSPLETIMRFMLTKAGMDPESVTYVSTGGPDTAIGLLASGQIDFLLMFEPTAVLCRLSGRCKLIWAAAESAAPAELAALNGGGPSMQFTAEFVEKNPAIIKAVIKAFTEAHAFFNNPANTEKIIQIVKSYEKADSRQDDELLRFLITQAQKRRSFHAHIDRKAVQAVIDYMYETKLIDQKVPVSELVYEGAPR